jgi:DnaJ-class molecular chaperone
MICLTCGLPCHSCFFFPFPLSLGEGMPVAKTPGTKGNLVIRFHILFPKYLNNEKRLKLRELLANEELQN